MQKIEKNVMRSRRKATPVAAAPSTKASAAKTRNARAANSSPGPNGPGKKGTRRNGAAQNGTGPHSAGVPGVISIHEIYTIDELFRRVGIGSQGIDAAKRAGLHVARFGRKRVVRGSDIDRFLAGHDPAPGAVVT